MCLQNFHSGFALGLPPVHRTFFEIGVGFGLGHAAAFDQDALGTVDQPGLLELAAQLLVFLHDRVELHTHRVRQTDGGIEQLAVQRLGQDEDAVLLDLGRNVVGDLGLDQQKDAGRGLMCCALCQLAAEFVRQGCVEEDQIIFALVQSAPRPSGPGF